MTETVEIDGIEITLSRTRKVFFPEDNITKGDLIEYYRRIADTMLPHLRGRPVTMLRFPNGIKGYRFYQKEAPEYFPAWIRRLTVEKENGTVTHLVCDNAAALVYLADQACISIHTWLSREDNLYCPDQIIFDLDPPGVDFKPVKEAALELRNLLREVGMTPYVKSTGSRGLHVVVPLDMSAGFDDVRNFAQEIAGLLCQRCPDRLTMEISKAKRKGRLYLDIRRNFYAQMAVATYSVRAKPGAPVAAALNWEEVEDEELGPQDYRITNIFDHLEKTGDPWSGMSEKACSIEKARRAMRAMPAGASCQGHSGPCIL
ncbi:MAG: ATP-dependent DNA ligase [Dehalococcoidia bacterium]|nr:ATP-dependent DNA ligase [Dehalococcoidia bacterium]